jgi:hypothetical protein
MQVQESVRLRWEKLNSAEPKHEFTYASVYRAKVPGGWLLTTFHSSGQGGSGVASTFVPDPGHTWDGGSLD